jgi:plasmid stabilization system protein ParE
VSHAYRLTDRAEADVEAIADFIAADSIDAAVNVVLALEDAFVPLASRPSIGHARADLTDRPLKFWSVYSYLVVYDSASGPYTIVAVLHGARDVAHIMKEIGWSVSQVDLTSQAAISRMYTGTQSLIVGNPSQKRRELLAFFRAQCATQLVIVLARGSTNVVQCRVSTCRQMQRVRASVLGVAPTFDQPAFLQRVHETHETAWINPQTVGEVLLAEPLRVAKHPQNTRV